MDPELLELVHKTVEERTGQSNLSATGYKDLLLTVDHSEHGQLLGWAGPKVKKKGKESSYNQDALLRTKADARFSRTRSNPYGEEKMIAFFEQALKDISQIGALPKDFIPSKFEYKSDLPVPEGKTGFVRGIYYPDRHVVSINPKAKFFGVTPLHELGHLIDSFLANEADYSSQVSGTIANKIVRMLRETDTCKSLEAMHEWYLSKTEEIFARAYAQYVSRQYPDSDYADEISRMVNDKALR